MHIVQHSNAVPVWMDCDPGNDDAFAILLASMHPAFSLQGVSTVHGNVLLEKTTRNALAILELLGFRQDEIKVYKGEALPIRNGNTVDAGRIHGESGLGGVNLPEPRLQVSTNTDYIDAMKAAVEKNPYKICFVLTGALTNFALFLRKYPDMCEKIRFVSIMGGAFHTGNITKYSEFNMRCDPDAAKIVFGEPLLKSKIILSPLNLTHTALANESVRSSIWSPKGSQNSALRRSFHDILMFYFATYEKKFQNHEGPPVHDPLAVFLLLPMIARESPLTAEFAREANVVFLHRYLDIETEGDRIGETSIRNGNMDPLLNEEGGVSIGFSVNVPLFWSFIQDALELADEQVAARSNHAS